VPEIELVNRAEEETMRGFTIGRVKGIGVGLCCAVAIGMATAGSASAVNRYAEPGGQASGACTDPDPGDGCEFEWAVEAAAGDNDNVILAPGSYTESGLIAVGNPGVDIIGPGTTQATLNSSGPTALTLNVLAVGASVSGLTINHTGNGDGLFLHNDMRVERLSVTSTAGTSACHAPGGAFILDTVCRNTNAGGVAAILIDPSGAATSGSSRLHNVTAYATGASANALRLSASLSGEGVITARNSIFRALGAGVDIRAADDGSSAYAEVDADYSAFEEAGFSGPSAEVTTPGTLNNIDALPLFTSANGNFHQAAGSPTIDKGTAALSDPVLSALDIDGEARIMGSAPDIGADEFVPPPAQPQLQPSTQSPAVGTGKKCPKGKKLVKKNGKRKCVRKKKRLK
jgi:hypothetical protein